MKRSRSPSQPGNSGGILLLLMLLACGLAMVFIGDSADSGTSGHRIFLVGMILCGAFGVSCIMWFLAAVLGSALRSPSHILEEKKDDFFDFFVD